MKRALKILAATVWLVGCAGQLFQAVPPGLDKTAVPEQSFKVTAEYYKFTPDTIRVKAGTLVDFKVVSIDGTHGFQLSAFGIDERLDEGKEKDFQVYAQKPGTYPFKCSHFCGLGHFGMNGVLIVE